MRPVLLGSGQGARRQPGDGRAIADVRGRGAAAAADQVQQAILGEAAQGGGHLFRRLVVLAEGVGQAGVGMRADVAVGDLRKVSTCGRIASRPARSSADRQRPRVRQRRMKASAVCPDRVRPEASVMVPEIITGRRAPRASKASSSAYSAALALSVSKMVSTMRVSAPPSIRPSMASR
jgi:hypothetical protein